MAKNIIKLTPDLKPIIPKKRVAAYARISMESERMNHSLSMQISYYNALIQRHADWEFVGIYSDDGISGTGTSKRNDFNKMIQDCENGKIDIILTKSISRFARNTVDLLNTTRRLKELGISVRFEKENIDSLSEDGELMLTLLASFAQEESRSISENVKWAIKKNFEKGIPNGKFRIFGYEWKDGHLVIVPEEATIVKRIYQNFLDGKSRLETERELEAEGIRTKLGYRFMDSNIKVILNNITYTGNMLLQKEYIVDPISKKRKKNKGELTQYFVENTHEAIIDMETFKYVQEEMTKRKKLGCFANKSLNLTCFSTKIKCECCGKNYVRSTRRNRAKNTSRGEKVCEWVCSTRKNKGGTKLCCSLALQEDILQRITASVLEISNFNASIFTEKIEKVTVSKDRLLTYFFKDGSIKKVQYESKAKKESWNDLQKDLQRAWIRKFRANSDTCSEYATRIKCGCCGHDYRSNMQIAKSSPTGKYRYWRCPICKNMIGLREDYLDMYSNEVLGLVSHTKQEFRDSVDYIERTKPDEIVFYMKDGRIIPHLWPLQYPRVKRGPYHYKEAKEQCQK